MDVKFYVAHSTVSPEPVDTTSSKTHVYLRKNVEEYQETRPDMPDAEPQTMYRYDEACLTKAEYALYLASTSSEEANTQAQLAIAELAEQQEANNTAMQQAIAELAEAILG